MDSFVHEHARWYRPRFDRLAFSVVPFLGGIGFVFLVLPEVGDQHRNALAAIAALSFATSLAWLWSVSRFVRVSPTGIALCTLGGRSQWSWHEVLAIRYLPRTASWRRAGYPLVTSRGPLKSRGPLGTSESTVRIPHDLVGIEELLADIETETGGRAGLGDPFPDGPEDAGTIGIPITVVGRAGLFLPFPFLVIAAIALPYPVNLILALFVGLYMYHGMRVPLNVDLGRSRIRVRSLLGDHCFTPDQLRIDPGPEPLNAGAVVLRFRDSNVVLSPMLHGIPTPQLMRMLVRAYPNAQQSRDE